MVRFDEGFGGDGFAVACVDKACLGFSGLHREFATAVDFISGAMPRFCMKNEARWKVSGFRKSRLAISTPQPALALKQYFSFD
ncbi:MAG: hypothetical protein Q8O19_05900 [Rectinemataceae bacterium]|nr:hypothetical protein [Rectinemataceae bacterium]